MKSPSLATFDRRAFSKSPLQEKIDLPYEGASLGTPNTLVTTCEGVDLAMAYLCRNTIYEIAFEGHASQFRLLDPSIDITRATSLDLLSALLLLVRPPNIGIRQGTLHQLLGPSRKCVT